MRDGSVELRIVDGGEGLVGPVTVLGQDVVVGTEPVRVEGATTLISDERGLAEGGVGSDLMHEVISVGK